MVLIQRFYTTENTEITEEGFHGIPLPLFLCDLGVLCGIKSSLLS
jgi:hypothetical protein